MPWEIKIHGQNRKISRLIESFFINTQPFSQAVATLVLPVKPCLLGFKTWCLTNNVNPSILRRRKEWSDPLFCESFILWVSYNGLGNIFYCLHHISSLEKKLTWHSQMSPYFI